VTAWAAVRTARTCPHCHVEVIAAPAPNGCPVVLDTTVEPEGTWDLWVDNGLLRAAPAGFVPTGATRHFPHRCGAA
jgi:hypothetical protein